MRKADYRDWWKLGPVGHQAGSEEVVLVERNLDKWVSRLPFGADADWQCYKLYTRRTENNSMPRFPVPEILRTPLEQLFLQVKAMDEDTDVRAFLR